MTWERWAWVALAVAATSLEAYTLHKQTDEKNDTATEMTRLIFHTDTLVGREVFKIVCRGVGEWFEPHTLAQGSIRAIKKGLTNA